MLLHLAIGCSRAPQVAPGNRKLLEALRTAISAKNPEWLESSSKLLAEKRAKEEISDVEFKTFSDIIEKAKSSDWKERK